MSICSPSPLPEGASRPLSAISSASSNPATDPALREIHNFNSKMQEKRVPQASRGQQQVEEEEEEEREIGATHEELERSFAFRDRMAAANDVFKIVNGMASEKQDSDSDISKSTVWVG